MNAFKKLANRFGFYSKDQIRQAQSGYAAAVINRLTQGWTSQNSSADSVAKMELSTLRARARELAINNDYAQKYLTMLKCNVLGDTGLMLRNKAKDPPSAKYPNGRLDAYANRVIEEAWWRWGQKKNCTVSKNLTWTDVQNICLEAVGRDGECLVRKVKGYNNDFGYALQIIESDFLDIEKNEKLANGNEIRMGVEFDKWRQPVAYHILKDHPSDFNFPSTTRTVDYYRLPAEEIIHPFLRRRPDQTRGMPMLATAMYHLHMLGKYEEAEVTAARAAASKMAFMVPTQGSGEYVGDTDSSGNKMMDAEPGAIEQLPFGMDLKVLDWNHPNASYQIVMKTALRGVASALNVSYNTLANDMESVNFASGKLGIEEERQTWRALQNWFAEDFANEVFEDWLKSCLLTQKIQLPFSKLDKFNSPAWQGRRWDYINPQQEVTAKIAAIRAGLTSVSRVLSERGLDRDEIFEEIADDKAKAEELGIELPDLEPDPSPNDPMDPKDPKEDTEDSKN